MRPPCTFLVVAHPNKKFWDALSTSPWAGCSTRSQGLWALWATLSAKLVLLISSSLNSAGHAGQIMGNLLHGALRLLARLADARHGCGSRSAIASTWMNPFCA